VVKLFLHELKGGDAERDNEHAQQSLARDPRSEQEEHESGQEEEEYGRVRDSWDAKLRAKRSTQINIRPTTYAQVPESLENKTLCQPLSISETVESDLGACVNLSFSIDQR